MLKICPTNTDSQASIAIKSEIVNRSVCFARCLGDHFNVRPRSNALNSLTEQH